jgi:hypothetical protein
LTPSHRGTTTKQLPSAPRTWHRPVTPSRQERLVGRRSVGGIGPHPAVLLLSSKPWRLAGLSRPAKRLALRSRRGPASSPRCSRHRRRRRAHDLDRGVRPLRPRPRGAARRARSPEAARRRAHTRRARVVGYSLSRSASFTRIISATSVPRLPRSFGGVRATGRR